MTTELTNTTPKSARRARARALVVANAASTGLLECLRAADYEVVEAATVEEGCAAIADQRPDIVFVDDAAAETIVETASDQEIPVVVLGPSAATTGPADAYIPAGAAAAAAVVAGLLLDRLRLETTVDSLETVVQGIRDGSLLVGRSPAMRRLHGALRKAADCDATVLIEGAVGTGKSTAARVIHCKSKRSDRPLFARAAADLEGEKLGQALHDSRGSTLIVEDVERLPPAAQQVLVRHLKDRLVSNGRDGVRLIATTSAHLPDLVARGLFREDLYYRLHGFPVTIPMLRERVDDILVIAQALVHQLASGASPKAITISPAASARLESMPWPGNVAQMESVLRHAVLAAAGGVIEEHHLTVTATPAAVPAPAVMEGHREPTEGEIRPFDEEEQGILTRALRATRGNVRRAAQLLGIGRATLYRKIQQYKLRLQ